MEILTNENLKDYKSIAIYGNIGSGKTALAFKILKELQQTKPVYVVKHPRPELLKPLGFRHLNSLDAILNLQDCVIYIDETQLNLGASQFKKEKMFIGILSLARQRNITIIVSTSDSRNFSMRIEAYFELWLIKDVNYSLSKQRSMIRYIIEQNAIISPNEVNLAVEEYLLYNRRNLDINGRHKFSVISEWTEQLSKPYYDYYTIKEIISDNMPDPSIIEKSNNPVDTEQEKGGIN